MHALDLPHVRAQYPAFEHGETSRWAFFENAGGSYVPRQVSDRLHQFFTVYKVQPYGHSYMQQLAGRAMDAGYEAVASMINARPDEVTLGPSTTMNLYVLAQALRPSLSHGDEIIVTNQDHEANIGCWRRLEEFGVVLREWRVDSDSGELDTEDLEQLVTGRTRVICFSLCSNIVGTVNDVDAICEIARSAGAITVADGVSFAPHWMPDVQTLGPDFVVFSTYKTFATHLGVLWGKSDRLSDLAPQGHFFNAGKPRYRMNPTGPLHAEIGALAGLGEYVDELYNHHFPEAPSSSLRARTEAVFSLFAEHETVQAKRILEFADGCGDLRIVGRRRAVPYHRAGTIALVPTASTPDQLARRLAERRIAAAAGHFYAVRCLEALGIAPERGVLRISLVHYNSGEDVDRLLSALEEALAES
ncbi:MAG: aminotransferase class V-fold PLP-dependent enzyme [Gammaproteobacteria bacterium]|nr:aminotransferase class V-fold PLP-dependent enzyme [Gammaproteobacteria bacterium]